MSSPSSSKNYQIFCVLIHDNISMKAEIIDKVSPKCYPKPRRIKIVALAEMLADWIILPLFNVQSIIKDLIKNKTL